MRTDACLLLDQFFYGITSCGGILLEVLYVQLLCLSRLSAPLSYRYLLQGLHGVHYDLYRHLSLGTAENAFPDSVADHRESDFNRVCRLQVKTEFTFQVSHRNLSLCQTGYGDKF